MPSILQHAANSDQPADHDVFVEGSIESLQSIFSEQVSIWIPLQGTKIFQYCTCPAGQVTYNFHFSCKHMHLSFKSICNKEHKGVICNMTYKVNYITSKIFTQSVS